MIGIYKYMELLAQSTYLFWSIPVQVDERLALLRLAEQKFFRGYSTMELMAQAKSEAAKKRVALVALLEVDAAERYTGMGEVDTTIARMCHDMVRAFIAVKNPRADVLTRGGSVASRN